MAAHTIIHLLVVNGSGEGTKKKQDVWRNKSIQQSFSRKFQRGDQIRQKSLDLQP